MEWFKELFTEPTFIQAVLVLSLISATGLALGKIKIFGVSLGVTFVFFAGIVAGHFGVAINPEMLALAQNFGLIIYLLARCAGRTGFLLFVQARRNKTQPSCLVAPAHRVSDGNNHILDN